jgi:hypothetical protein
MPVDMAAPLIRLVPKTAQPVEAHEFSKHRASRAHDRACEAEAANCPGLFLPGRVLDSNSGILKGEGHASEVYGKFNVAVLARAHGERKQVGYALA